MNTILKVLAFSAPIFAVVLFVWLQVYQKFSADYAVENVRFERKWQAWEKEFGLNATEDEFLAEQEEEARRLWQKGRVSTREIERLRWELKEVLENADNSTNSTGEGGNEKGLR